MAIAPLHPCPGSPTCPARVPRGERCPAHALQKEHNRTNLDVRKWYYTERWAALRLQVFVDQDYRCADCGHVTLELEAHHIIRHHGDPALFWDRANIRGLCKPCHSARTGRGE